MTHSDGGSLLGQGVVDNLKIEFEECNYRPELNGTSFMLKSARKVLV
jgi:hypothetical protein